MLITSKSLERSNVAFLMSKDLFRVPDNQDFAGLYSGALARGTRFVDDPHTRIKYLNVPVLNLTFMLEGERFRVDDDAGLIPEESKLIQESLRAFHDLFPQPNLESFGFNFDIYYRFGEIIPMDHWFAGLYKKDLLAKKDLMNFGFQFMLNTKNGSKETYFLKVVSPLELVVHANYHFNSKTVPNEKKLQTMFFEKYDTTDEVINMLDS